MMTKPMFLAALVVGLVVAEGALGAIAEGEEEAGAPTGLIIKPLELPPGSTGGNEINNCPRNASSVMASADQESREALHRMATSCFRERKATLAVALLTQVIRKDPADAVAYLNRGSGQAALGEVALALADFTTAISLQPELADAWFNRGTTFMRVRLLKNAVDDFTQVIRLNPGFARAYCNRGSANVQLGHY
ncbi:MAG: tetratricopeptide repeat protein, partial [Methyloceanibacter sp.]